MRKAALALIWIANHHNNCSFSYPKKSGLGGNGNHLRPI